MGSVLITGCSSGFGRLSALALARRGERVFATMRDVAAGSGLVAVAEEEGLALSVHRLDVCDEKSVGAAVAAAVSEQPLDALVNNAGQRGPRGPLTALADGELAAVFDVNVFGVVRMVRAVAPSMLRRGLGRIVNVSSMAGLVGSPYESAYSMSKHAVEALSESLRWELAPGGVRVALIEPGAYATEFFSTDLAPAAFGAEHPERDAYARISEAVERAILGERLQDPAEVAAAICSAVLDPEDIFRRVVGRDAQAISSLKRELPYEQYEARLRTLFGLEEPVPAAAS